MNRDNGLLYLLGIYFLFIIVDSIIAIGVSFGIGYLIYLAISLILKHFGINI